MDKVMAFNLGAEDYITKPFDTIELRARVEARLRLLKKENESDVTTYGPLRVDAVKQSVDVRTENGVWSPLSLTFTEFRLVSYFTKHAELVLSRNQIIEYVWGLDVNVINRNVDSHVSSLRKKLAPHSKLIRSIHGLGYKFSVLSYGHEHSGRK